MRVCVLDMRLRVVNMVSVKDLSIKTNTPNKTKKRHCP